MIPSFKEALQRMDHAAFAHLYAEWATLNPQAPLPRHTNEADLTEDWRQLLDAMGLNAPESFLTKLVTVWGWALHQLGSRKEEVTAHHLNDLLGGKNGYAASALNREGILLDISPAYKKLTALLGPLSEETLGIALQKQFNQTSEVQLFLMAYVMREALFGHTTLPTMTKVGLLTEALRTQLEAEFGAVSPQFCDKLTALWLYGLYFAGAPLTAEKRLRFLDQLVVHPNLVDNLEGFSGVL